MSDRLSLVFAALADPTRRNLLERLSAGPLAVGALAAHYDISRPAISQHLAVLERAGLIDRTQDAQWRRCSVREEGLDPAAAWIEKHRTDWNERFDLLEDRIREKRRVQ